NPPDVTPAIRYVNAKPSGTRALTAVGVKVKKSGDTTGLTDGIVVGLNGTIGPFTINGVANVYLKDSIVTSGMSDGGDSGALVLDNLNQAVGLLFGGLQHTNAC